MMGYGGYGYGMMGYGWGWLMRNTGQRKLRSQSEEIKGSNLTIRLLPFIWYNEETKGYNKK